MKDEQPKPAAHLSLLKSIELANTQTSVNFFTNGLSMDFLVRVTGLEPALSRTRT